MLLGIPSNALACFDSSLYYNNCYGQAWFSRATSLFALGRECESVESIDKATEYIQNDEFIELSKGDALFLCGRVGEAWGVFSQLLSNRTPDPILVLRLGFTLLSMSQFCSALSIADEGLKYNPSDDGFWMLKSLVLNIAPIEALSDHISANLHLSEQDIGAIYSAYQEIVYETSVINIGFE